MPRLSLRPSAPSSKPEVTSLAGSLQGPRPVAAVVGAGPAGLMAAYTLAKAGCQVDVYEKRPAPGRKLLIAGSSGLNIGYVGETSELLPCYSSDSAVATEFEASMGRILSSLDTSAWLDFVHSLGVATFEGTSRRYFVEGLKAPPLLAAWLARLRELGVRLHCGHEWVGWKRLGEEGSPQEGSLEEGGSSNQGSSVESGPGKGIELCFSHGQRQVAEVALIAVGGGSWETSPVVWPALLEAQGVACRPLTPANVGFQVVWPAGLVEEAEGLPLKNVVLHSPRGSRAGDLVITRYGLEGTPVYFVGQPGRVFLDLKPDLDLPAVRKRLAAPRERLSPHRRIKRTLKLCDGALALLYHLAPPLQADDLEAWARCIKAFELDLVGPQPLAEAISSGGGVRWDELDEHLMVRRVPGLFVAGEMIDWDAPTGGFLIHGCVATGHAAAQGMLAWLGRKTPG